MLVRSVLIGDPLHLVAIFCVSDSMTVRPNLLGVGWVRGCPWSSHAEAPPGCTCFLSADARGS
jgi:hypothetical protein